MLTGVTMVSAKHLWAEDGSYCVATQAPGAAALAYGIITAFSDTAALILVQNTSVAAAQKRLYLDYLRLIPTVAPASATAAFYAIKMDGVLRTPTANSVALTNANVNMGQTSVPVGKAFAATGGTLTIPAASPAARVTEGNGIIRSALPVVNDEFIIDFGAADIQSGDQLGGTAPLRLVAQTAAVILDAQQSAAIYLWFPGNAATALSYLVAISWGER